MHHTKSSKAAFWESEKWAYKAQTVNDPLSVKLYIFSYPSVLTHVLGAQKNRLIETVLLSTHNICFGLETRKLIWVYTLLTKGLMLYFHQVSSQFNCTVPLMTIGSMIGNIVDPDQMALLEAS